MEKKVRALSKQAGKHDCLIERTFNLERNIEMARNGIEVLKRENK